MRIVGRICGYTFMPGTTANWGRISWMICSAAGRSSRGFRRMKIRPVLSTVLEPLAPMPEKNSCT